MPVDMRDWLPEDDVVVVVLDAVDTLDLGAFRRSYRADGHGRAAFDPAMMVALLLYGYCQGERSSRQIERRCVRDVAYRVIVGGLHPDHATIARFRARHEKALGGLFSQVLRLLAAEGGMGCASAASRGVQLVLLPLVDGVAAVASAVGGEVTEADRDDDDGDDPQGVRGEADQPEDQCGGQDGQHHSAEAGPLAQQQ